MKTHRNQPKNDVFVTVLASNKQLFNHINEGNRYTFSGSETQGTERFVSVECLQVQHSKRNSACGKTLRNRRLLSQAQTLGANYSLCEPQEHS